MINQYVVKKYAALLLCGMITSICFFMGLRINGFIWALAWLAGGLLFTVIIGTLLLRNPFQRMLEGKGILAINMDSTGVLRPFIVSVNSPYIKGKIQGKKILDTFDRKTVFSWAVPQKSTTKATLEDGGGITIKLTEDKYNKARFGFFHYPCIIWNGQINGVITKDFLSEKESGTFAEHGVLYLNRKLEELTSNVRDFGRYVVEMTKPKKSIFESKWTWIILIVFGAIMLAMFAPAIINAIKGVASPASDTLSKLPNVVNPQ